jgi:ribosomal protein S26
VNRFTQFVGILSVALAKVLIPSGAVWAADDLPICSFEALSDEARVQSADQLHSRQGQLMVDAELRDHNTFTIQEKYPRHFKRVDLQKPIFLKPPSLSAIYQDSSLDCGFLSPLASVVSYADGPSIIEKSMFDDLTSGMVYVRFFVPRDFAGRYAGFRKIMVKLDKVRDTGGSWRYAKFTSRSKLWVHLMERAYAAAFGDFPVNKLDAGISPRVTFEALLSPDRTHIQSGNDMNYSPNPKDAFTRIRSARPQIQSRFLNRLSVFSRSAHAVKSGQRRADPEGLFSAHYYAQVSPVCTYGGKKGILLFNPLNRDNSVRGLFTEQKRSRIFFSPLESVADFFTSAVSVRSRPAPKKNY